jgi:arsenate reductase
MKNILFLCTGNSCRSQMAEGFGTHLKGSQYTFYSAGTKTHGLNPRAVQVMKEVGIDISTRTSKTPDMIPQKMDVVFTVCSDAHDTCPFLPGVTVIHVGFDDPPRLTKNMTNEEEILSIYRKVRDQIKDFILTIDTHLGDKK